MPLCKQGRTIFSCIIRELYSFLCVCVCKIFRNIWFRVSFFGRLYKYVAIEYMHSHQRSTSLMPLIRNYFTNYQVEKHKRFRANDFINLLFVTLRYILGGLDIYGWRYTRGNYYRKCHKFSLKMILNNVTSFPFEL